MDFADGVLLCGFSALEYRFRVFFPTVRCEQTLGVMFYPDKGFTQTYMFSLLIYLGSAILHWQINVTIKKMFGESGCSKQDA